MSGYQESDDKALNQEGSFRDIGPLEPEKGKLPKTGLFKWIFFLFVVVYILISYYHAPILTRLGRYLIVEHDLQKSDLIVCLAGGNIERGLATADVYHKGLAPRIFLGREEFPDGYSLLKEKGLNYPESVDLLIMILKGLGIPRSALLISDRPVKSTFDEAKTVKALAVKNGYRSLILVTSPTHSRRAWLVFRKVFEDEKVRILALPSKYSEFRPEEWWKKSRYIRVVIIEYQKLIFYALKYFI